MGRPPEEGTGRENGCRAAALLRASCWLLEAAADAWTCKWELNDKLVVAGHRTRRNIAGPGGTCVGTLEPVQPCGAWNLVDLGSSSLRSARPWCDSAPHKPQVTHGVTRKNDIEHQCFTSPHLTQRCQQQLLQPCTACQRSLAGTNSSLWKAQGMYGALGEHDTGAQLNAMLHTHSMNPLS